jgi:poly-gamma-glutamate synthesis protein (capsule biosynthesis protein)
VVPFGDQTISSTTETRMQINNSEVAIFGIYAVNTKPDFNALASRLVSYGTSTFTVAYIHWGTEYAPVHTAEVEENARRLSLVGFDLIVGHHPHVAQDIAVVNGVPVVYSLGNFIFDQYFSNAVQEGYALELSLSSTTTTLSVLPYTSLDSRSQPRYLSDEEKQTFLKSLAAKSEPHLSDAISAGVLTFPRVPVANILQSTSIAE